MIQIHMSEAEFGAAARRLEQQHGIQLSGPEGKISRMGVTAGYQHADGLLRVTILEKPFFLSTDQCEAQLRRFLDGDPKNA